MLAPQQILLTTVPTALLRRKSRILVSLLFDRRVELLRAEAVLLALVLRSAYFFLIAVPPREKELARAEIVALELIARRERISSLL